MHRKLCSSIKKLIFRHFHAKLAENWSKKEILLKKFFFPLLIINIPYIPKVTFWLSFLHVCSQDDWGGDDVFVHKDTEADHPSDDKQPGLK